jgi:hypothetical protein
LLCLNGFFSPQSDSEAKRLFSTFLGTVSGNFGTSSMKITESDSILRKIVVPGELKRRFRSRSTHENPGLTAGVASSGLSPCVRLC